MGELEQYAERFRRLNVNRGGGRPSPHKPCMLLAVIDWLDDRETQENCIRFAPDLIERYQRYFNAVRGPNDHPRPHYPFFFLKNDGFWHLHPQPGREQVLAGLRQVSSVTQVTANVDHASLDAELFTLLCDPTARASLADVLVRHWFDRSAGELQRMLDDARAINRYAYQLRQGTPSGEVREIPVRVRDPAFRRVVLEAYDYRCAATGTRIILPDELASVMVEAAHIEPVAEGGNDDPRNGLALRPDIHWAMDRYAIAPTPEYTWKVSPRIDRRLLENQLLAGLDGTPLILPREKRLWPAREYLAWRAGKLF